MKEEILFSLYKDKPLCNTLVFRKKMSEYKDIDANKLYIRITNYQVEKYGCTLDDDKYVSQMTIDECKKIGRKLRTQQLERKKKYGRNND